MERATGWQLLVLGFQHTLAMFGATVLVPIITGLDTSVALFTAGAGTLLFHFLTRRKVPVFLGSSFAFLAGILTVKAMYATEANPDAGLPYATGGIMAAGAVYLFISLLISVFGAEKIRSFLPPVVIGPVIMTIGLILTPVAYGMAQADWTVALITLATVGVTMVFGRGFLRALPVLLGVGVGYGVAIARGLVNFAPVAEAKLLAVPAFHLPQFSWEAILVIAPIALVTVVEHVGDITTNSATVGKDFVTDPGLNRTVLGDGVATILAGLFGGPANTTYGENTGVLAITRVYDPRVLRTAAGFAVGFAFIGTLGALLRSIPEPVMGGVSIALFGMIAAIGMRVLVENQVDFADGRNLLIAAVVLTLGMMAVLGENNPAAIQLSDTVRLEGLSLATLVGVILNKVLPEERGVPSAEETTSEAELEVATAD